MTDFLSGEPVVLSEGATAPALLASSAFPGLYPPVSVAARRFIGGGVSADVPVLQAEQVGATVTYVLPAPTSVAGNPLAFGDTERLIANGYRLATQWLTLQRELVASGAPSDGLAVSAS